MPLPLLSSRRRNSTERAARRRRGRGKCGCQSGARTPSSCPGDHGDRQPSAQQDNRAASNSHHTCPPSPSYAFPSRLPCLHLLKCAVCYRSSMRWKIGIVKKRMSPVACHRHAALAQANLCSPGFACRGRRSNGTAINSRIYANSNWKKLYYDICRILDKNSEILYSIVSALT